MVLIVDHIVSINVSKIVSIDFITINISSRSQEVHGSWVLCIPKRL